MDILHSVRQQVYDLVSGIDDTRLFHGFRIVTETVNDGLEAFGQVGAGHGSDALDLLDIRHRHNACNNRNRNALFSDTVQEVVHDVVIKEHLRGQKFTACVYFFLEVQNILGFIGCLNVTLRVAGAADAEIALRLDIAYQFSGIVVVRMRSTTLRNITAQRKNILDTGILILFLPSLQRAHG